jgi:hypothetical protein
MTVLDEGRIRAISDLIVKEKDPEKVKALAEELGRLLTLERKPMPTSVKPVGRRRLGV